MESQNANRDILNSKEADEARAVIGKWLYAFYLNLEYWAERGYVDTTITDYDPCGPDWPDDNADDVEPEMTARR